MRINGQPSPADLAKTATISDGVGPHEHDGSGPHEHGAPSFTDAQVKILEAPGWHVDRHHTKVYDAKGGEVTPLHVGAALQEAGQEDTTKVASTVSGEIVVTKAVSGAGESPPVLRHLDLRHQS